jgi:hypothetical protein
MTGKENDFIKIDSYECLTHNSTLKCKTCDGFGRNTEKSVCTEECYVSLNKMRLYLDISKDKNNLYGRK